MESRGEGIFIPWYCSIPYATEMSESASVDAQLKCYYLVDITKLIDEGKWFAKAK